MMTVTHTPEPQQQGRGVASDPLLLDDFAEFLTRSYAPVLDAFADHGLVAEIVRGGSGAYAVIITGRQAFQKVVLTDGGRPLPDQPADVLTWRISSLDRPPTSMPGEAPLVSVVDAVTARLAQM